jgi:probable HAF family extracellular repeat protein
MQDLGTLPGGADSRAFDINNQGQVVGTSTNATSTRAFLWTRLTGMQDLNAFVIAPPGLELSEALCINSQGQIAVGASAAKHDEHEEHEPRVFLLIR